MSDTRKHGPINALLTTPKIDELTHIGDVLASWQRDDQPIHLHPGDLGWFSGNGPEATAAATRVWSIDGEIVAIGLLDESDLLRMALAPDHFEDEELAARIAADINDPGKGALPAGEVNIEARGHHALRNQLSESGWQPGEVWTPFHRRLNQPVREITLRVEPLAPDQYEDWAKVHWSAFKGTTLTDESRQRIVSRLHAIASGPFATRARMLAGFNDNGMLVAGAIVWTAGSGRPALLEPLAVHQDHRFRGYARALIDAGAAEMQATGASSLLVTTDQEDAIAAYARTGFVQGEPIADLHRPH